MKKYLIIIYSGFFLNRVLSLSLLVSLCIFSMADKSQAQSTISETELNPGSSLIKRSPGSKQPGKPVPVKPGSGSNPEKNEGNKSAEPPVVVPKTVVPAPPVQTSSGSSKNYGNITLRFDPVMLRLTRGEVAEQSLVLDNPKGIMVDKAEVVIKYSTRYLSVHDADSDMAGINLRPAINFQRNPTVEIILNQVDTTKGIIRFTVKSLTENAYLGGNLATIQWVGKKSCFYTPLTFWFSEQPNALGTRVQRAGRDLLGWDYDPKDGIISGGVTVLNPS